MNDHHYFKFTPSVWLVPTFLLILIWSVFYVENIFNVDLSVFGVFPRTISGLKGVFLSPFIHGNMNHIANNSLPLFILTTALIFFYREVSLKVLFYGIVFSGLITWVIARDSYHIGASGLIYVLVSFIFFKGLMTQYYRLIALSLTVVVLYGGMIWYVFPDIDKTISWEGHLAGLITGFVFAVRLKTPDYIEEIRYDWEKPNFDPQGDPFMKRFDENGNFVNPPKPEEIMVEYEEVVSEPVRYIYTLKENREGDK